MYDVCMQVYYQLSMHAGYYLLVLVSSVHDTIVQCRMHASLYYEYGMILCSYASTLTLFTDTDIGADKK
jgi:hypothetical protein